MLKFMKKLPAGTLLVPMFVSALINTLAPDLFNIGGMTEALLSGSGVTFIVGMLNFVSASMLDIKTIREVFKKQGVILLLKIVVCFVFGFIAINLLGSGTVVGISALAIIVAICSCNPALYLALVGDYGEPKDAGAFGLLGLVSSPALPMLIYGMAKGGNIDWMGVVSVLIPIFLGIIIGNLDPDMAKLGQPSIGILMVLLGWGLGSNINLINALKAGATGVIIVVVFYAILIPPLLFTEKKLLKSSGVSALAMTSVAGVSLAAPASVATLDYSLLPLLEDTIAQLSFAVIITSIITPILVKKIHSMYSAEKGTPEIVPES